MFSLLKNRKKIVTHDSKFHADDIFACAMVELLLDRQGEEGEIIRTRNEQRIAEGDYVVDVGGVFDISTNRFDHHQIGGAGKRENGIPYAACGLVWKTYGTQLSGSIEVAAQVDAALIQCIDADDNGYSLIELKQGIRPYRLQEALYAFRPTWKEEQDFDAAFLKLVPLAKNILTREIAHATDGLLATSEVHKAYEAAKDKRIIELSTNFPFQKTLTSLPEPLYEVNPRPTGGWKIEAVAKGPNTFDLRKPLPQAWAGLRDAELAKVSGVPDAIFCHNGCFMAVAKTREGALALAEKAANA
jgi:uncharacterized UPF0160 family protein